VRASLSAWDQFATAPALGHPLAGDVAAWLDGLRHGRRVALFALQPCDWLTFEGVYAVTALDNLVMQWLADLPEEWIAVPTYHSVLGAQLSPATERSLSEEFPALKVLPPDLATGLSEILLPHVDAVVTISSSVGMSALLHGKVVVSPARSALASLGGRQVAAISRTPALADTERAGLLAFLSNRYCHPLTDCTEIPGYVTEIARRIVTASDPIGDYFDLRDWSPARLKPLLAS